MSTRRSRPSRSRKSRPSQAPQHVALDAPVLAPPGAADVLVTAVTDPSMTAQLRALEAGWDELLA